MVGQIADMVEVERRNALVARLFTGFVFMSALRAAVGWDLVWGGFASAVLLLAVLPAFRFGSSRVMLPWEAIALASLPLLGRFLGAQSLQHPIAVYGAIAAIALMVAAELVLFTPVRMTPRFAVAFVALTTIASAGVLAVAQWLVERFVGWGVLPGERTVMLGFVAATGTGLAAGLLFDMYFRRSGGGRRADT